MKRDNRARATRLTFRASFPPSHTSFQITERRPADRFIESISFGPIPRRKEIAEKEDRFNRTHFRTPQSFHQRVNMTCRGVDSDPFGTTLHKRLIARSNSFGEDVVEDLEGGGKKEDASVSK